MSTFKNLKVKRKYHYIHLPQVYGIANCPHCNSNNTTWSEWEEYIRCYDCEKDFIPNHWGIFDGTMPLHLCKLMSISFDRVEVETGKIISFGDLKWKETFYEKN